MKCEVTLAGVEVRQLREAASHLAARYAGVRLLQMQGDELNIALWRAMAQAVATALVATGAEAARGALALGALKVGDRALADWLKYAGKRIAS